MRAMKIKDSIDSFLVDQKSSIEKMLVNTDDIVQIVNVLLEARDKGHKIYTMGNGGSSSTSSHFASDLLKTAITEGDKRFMAFSLTDNIPVVSAWANDVSFDNIFVEQLKNFLQKNDIVIAFSGSGKSKNVVNAISYGKEIGALCIGITGMKGGFLSKICDICLIVPSNDMLTIESLHLVLCHCIVNTIRNNGKPVFRYE